MRFAVSASEHDRVAVCTAVQPFFESSPVVDENGFVVFSGSCSDVEAADAAVREAGALGVFMSEEESEEGKVEDALVVESSDEVASEPASESTSDSEEIASEPVPELLPFCARFSRRVATDGAPAFCRSLAGLVVFSEPPTEWVDGELCVRGSSRDLPGVEIAAQLCGGTTEAPRAVEAPHVDVEAPRASVEAPTRAERRRR